MRVEKSCKNILAAATGALILTAGLALALPNQAHAANTITTGEELSSTINSMGASASYDAATNTVTLNNDLTTSNKLSFYLDNGQNVTLDLNGHAINFTGTSTSQIVVNGSKGGMLEIRGYEDFSKTGTISYSQGNLFKIKDNGTYPLGVSGVTINAGATANAIAKVEPGEGLTGTSTLWLTRDTINVNGGEGFVMKDETELLIEECTINCGANTSSNLVNLNGPGANVTVRNSTIYTPYVPDFFIFEDTCPSGMNRIDFDGSYVNFKYGTNVATKSLMT